MNTNIEKLISQLDASKFAYIRAIAPEELEALPNEALSAISDPASLYVLSNGDGEKLAIVEGREEAFAAAAAHEFLPMSVH